MNTKNNSTIPLYFFVSFISFALLFGQYLSGINSSTLGEYSGLYVLSSFWIHYLLYYATLVLVAWLILWLTRRRPNIGLSLISVGAIVLTIWMYVDARVYALLNLHINHFILEVLMQEDAFGHIGVSPLKMAQGSWPLLLYLLPHILIAKLIRVRVSVFNLSRKSIYLTSFFLVFMIGVDKLAYAYFYYKGYPFVFELKKAPPVYPLVDSYYMIRFYEELLGEKTRVGFMEKLGDKIKEDVNISDAININYQGIVSTNYRLKDQFNIIIVVAESLRSQDFNSDSAPFLTQLAKEEISANQHYSNSNTTHLGLFSLFYGLNPFYFHEMRTNKIAPVGIELLSNNDYRIYITIARTMKWYDLDEFVFGKNYTTYEPEGSNPVRDRSVTDKSIELVLQHKKLKSPYLNFVYYYATHADYDHPDDVVIFSPELKGDIDFTDSTLRDKRDELINRYKNSIFFLDMEMKRLVTVLKESGEWENTVLIFTGDHGEEFFEENKFGHNSSLNQYQTKVPLIMHLPGIMQKKINKLTSHMDVFQTILKHGGMREETLGAFQGRDMLSPDSGPIYIGKAHYQRPEKYAILNDNYKIIIDLKDNYPRVEAVTDLEGKQIDLPSALEMNVLGLLKQFRDFKK